MRVEIPGDNPVDGPGSSRPRDRLAGLFLCPGRRSGVAAISRDGPGKGPEVKK